MERFTPSVWRLTNTEVISTSATSRSRHAATCRLTTRASERYVTVERTFNASFSQTAPRSPPCREILRNAA